MPNWCDNELYIRGPKADRDAFVVVAKSSKFELDFNNFIPYPLRFGDLDRQAAELTKKIDAMTDIDRTIYFKDHSYPKDGFNQGGYEWCCNNWGTKWNACDTRRRESKTSIRYDFNTAWSPPIPVVNAMAAKFPNLTFVMRSFEQGGCFQGRYVIKGSVVIENLTKKYYGRRGG